MVDVELHARQGARIDRAKTPVGECRDADVLRRAQASVGEGHERAARQVVVGEEIDGVAREALPLDEPPEDLHSAPDHAHQRPFGLVGADADAADADPGIAEGGFGVALGVAAELDDLPDAALGACRREVPGREVEVQPRAADGRRWRLFELAEHGVGDAAPRQVGENVAAREHRHDQVR